MPESTDCVLAAFGLERIVMLNSQIVSASIA